MIKSKSIEVLKSLSREEFKEFGKFVRSPYFSENRKLVELYKILKSHYPGFASRTFTKEIIYQKLFPGKKYNDSTMRKLFSGLLDKEESFLSHYSLDRFNKFYKELFLLNNLGDKKLDKLFDLNFKRVNELYRENSKYEDDYFRNNFDTVVAKLNHDIGTGRGGFDSKEVMDDLLKCSNYLISYSLIVALKLNQDILARSVSFEFDHENTMVFKFIEVLGGDRFIEQINSYAPEFYPVVAIYYFRFLVASGRDTEDKYFFRMNDLITKNLKNFSRFEQYNLLLFIENSCDENIKNGKKFQEELFDVHNLMLSSGIYTYADTDYLSLIGFRKMIRNALVLKKYEWAEDFIKDYINKLPAEFIDNMKNYSQALLNFHRGMFDAALKDISKVRFEVYSFKFDVWMLKLLIEYELGYYIEAAYSIDSYRHSLKTDLTSPAWMKKQFSNFLNIYHKLVKAAENKGGELMFLKKEAAETENLYDREWLIKKIDLLMK